MSNCENSEQSGARKSRAPEHRIRSRYFPPSILAAIFAALIVATITRVPMADDVESSWSSVLTYAHQNGLQLGRDIVFTYGPVGFLTVPCFSGSFVAARLMFDIALGLAVSIPLCLVSWRLTTAWRFLVLAAFLVVTSNIEAEAQD